jgi:hypothetical protein
MYKNVLYGCMFDIYKVAQVEASVFSRCTTVYRVYEVHLSCKRASNLRIQRRQYIDQVSVIDS